jgi:hypothetical protein
MLAEQIVSLSRLHQSIPDDMRVYYNNCHRAAVDFAIQSFASGIMDNLQRTRYGVPIDDSEI